MLLPLPSAKEGNVMKLLVIIPTFNEADNITNLIENILFYVPDAAILVIDDSSPDGTAETVEKLKTKLSNLYLIKRDSKAGIASAYIEGFRYGIKNNFDVFLQMDADFSHNPEYIPEMLQQLQKYDVVIGSRLVKGGGTKNRGVLRQIITLLGSLYAGIILNCPIKDLTGGFNMWSITAIEKINLNNIISNGYAFQIEMKYKAYKNGCKIKEIPIIFNERFCGKSKITAGILAEALIKIFRLLK